MTVLAHGPRTHPRSFHVKAHTDFGDTIVVVGSHPALGMWNPRFALFLGTSEAEYPLWRAPTVDLPPDVEYKYVRLKRDGRAEWEMDGENRCLPACCTKAIVEDFGLRPQPDTPTSSATNAPTSSGWRKKVLTNTLKFLATSSKFEVHALACLHRLKRKQVQKRSECQGQVKVLQGCSSRLGSRRTSASSSTTRASFCSTGDCSAAADSDDSSSEEEGIPSASPVSSSPARSDGSSLHFEVMARRELSRRPSLLHLPTIPGPGEAPPKVYPASPELTLWSGSANRPHPEKVSTGGADSSFCCRRAAGVADGVGEWEYRFGINARAFADELMEGCRVFLDDPTNDDPCLLPSEKARASLRHGFQSARSWGASTATVAVLGRENLLGVSNLGDSGLLLLRRKEVDSKEVFYCEGRTKEQQHAFNCPYQLTLMPTPDDFPELLRLGKDKLVRAIERTMQRNPAARSDQPEDSELQDFHVQEGDLLVLSTDGVLDNLYTDEVCDIVSKISQKTGRVRSSEFTDPGDIAEAIVQAAFQKSLDRHARTPFADHAGLAGESWAGGKMDDITCVCAWVTAQSA